MSCNLFSLSLKNKYSKVWLIQKPAVPLRYQNEQTMNTIQNEAATNISVALFEGMISRLETKIQSNSFKHELKYDSKIVNETLSKDFGDIVSVLNSVVDKFYLKNYEIQGFVPFSLNDLDFCISHNLGLINNCKKLLKFMK